MAKIAIDCGHGLYTSGKRCLASLDPKQTREWVLNDRVGDEVVRLLEAAGHTVFRVDDEDGSTDVSLSTRVTTANKKKADAYISIHHNAGVNGGSGGGTVVYTCVGCQAKSTQLQNAVYKHAIARGKLKGNRSDGTLSKNFYVIKNTTMPAILIECGFMDSSTDIKYILDPEWSKKIALGIAEGACEVFGGKINASTNTSSNASTNTSTAKGKGELAVDGSFGPASVSRTQEYYGTLVDGTVSNQPISNKEYLPNAYEDVWEFTYDCDGGSQMIKAMQTDLKSKGYYDGVIDGWCGPKTIMALQEFLRDQDLYTGDIDGYMGPLTVKAWQRYLNEH